MNEMVKTAVEQAGSLASAAKESAPGFIESCMKGAKNNSYAIAAVGAMVTVFCIGRYIFPKSKKNRKNH